jgi:2-polyprenyl-3-methyl-5-hydroxy-6-metoxy-1,4-benzoquinol methylase
MSERIQPSFNNYNDGPSMSHISRYLLARGFIERHETVLDMACGVGYGTYILADRAKLVSGHDKENVFDEKYFVRDNAYFTITDINKVHNDKMKFDSLVCLETIEHLNEPEKFIDWAVKNIKSKIIISSPDKDTTDTNPFHKSNVEFKELQRMFKKYEDWKCYQVFYQDVYYIAIYVNTKEDIINN